MSVPTKAINIIDPAPVQTGLVDITYYTDPLCCWSWAMEQDWKKLQNEFAGNISWRYCMGGLLPSWQVYHDTLNAVTRPIQMGPVWMHARQLSGVPINDRIWMSDPPASSFPACIAVKSAEMQSKEHGEKYLGLLREAVMVNAQNIAKTEVLQAIASELKNADETFDVDQFNNDLIHGGGSEAFKKDLQEVQSRGIDRFPTFIVRYQQQAIMLTGYRPYAALVEAIYKLAPALQRQTIES
jgi:putative protein-disulfide isomerase